MKSRSPELDRAVRAAAEKAASSCGWPNDKAGHGFGLGHWNWVFVGFWDMRCGSFFGWGGKDLHHENQACKLFSFVGTVAVYQYTVSCL